MENEWLMLMLMLMFGQTEALSVAGLQGLLGGRGVRESLQVSLQPQVFHSHELRVEPGAVQSAVRATRLLLVQAIQIDTPGNYKQTG